MFAVALITFLALYNATKRPDSDWYWYIDSYAEVLHLGVSTFLDAGGLSIRVSEPLYYWFSWIVAVMSGGNVPILALIITYMIYVPYVAAIERLLERFGLEEGLAISCVIFALIAGLTFTLSLHLVRQYMAGTILFLTYIWLLEGKNLKVAVAVTVGVLVHNSFLIPASLLLISRILWTSTTIRRHFFKVAFTLFILGFALGDLTAAWALDSPFAQSALKDDGGVSAIVLLIDAGMFLAASLWLWTKREVEGILEMETAVSLIFLALFGGILVGVRDLMLIFLRFYFYVEWFRVIGLIALCRMVPRAKPRQMVPLIVCSLSVAWMYLRIERASWDYGGSLVEHLLGSMSWWVSQLGHGGWGVP